MTERRQDCIDHENRIDDMAKETHKFGGWFKVAGSGLMLFASLMGWFGSSINAKLDTIQSLLNRHEVSMAELGGRIKSCEADITEIKTRHQYLDQSGVVKVKR
jgi:hypothetical protein